MAPSFIGVEAGIDSGLGNAPHPFGRRRYATYNADLLAQPGDRTLPKVLTCPIHRGGDVMKGVLGAAILLTTGCMSIAIPMSDGRNVANSPLYVSKDQLEEILAKGATREYVTSRLGEYDARNGYTRGRGFVRCLESERRVTEILLPVIPISETERVNSCELILIWFNEEGRAVRAASFTLDPTDSLNGLPDPMLLAELQKLLNYPCWSSGLHTDFIGTNPACANSEFTSKLLKK